MITKIKIYCVTDKPLNFLENSSLLLAGVGKNSFSDRYINSKINNPILQKEKYYSELTFHYWYWKNLLPNENNEWVGFCQKRRFWIKKTSINTVINKYNLQKNLLEETEVSWKLKNSILCNPIKISGAKKIKIIKRGWRNILLKPNLLFKTNQENLNIHFDMHHGYGNLNKAIKLVDKADIRDFESYVNINNTYNPHLMFIARPEIIDKWFSFLFPWLERCEEVFGFKDLNGYDTQRLYAYLAERYLSFWFKKYTKFDLSPWAFVDYTNNGEM